MSQNIIIRMSKENLGMNIVSEFREILYYILTHVEKFFHNSGICYKKEYKLMSYMLDRR